MDSYWNWLSRRGWFVDIRMYLRLIFERVFRVGTVTSAHESLNIYPVSQQAHKLGK